MLGGPSPEPRPEHLARVDRRLREAQADELRRAVVRGELEAYRLEVRHFEDLLEQQQVPELTKLPLLRQSSGRIVDFLVETHPAAGGAARGLIRRVQRYFRYGSLRGLDPGDTDVILRLQHAFYVRRIEELQHEEESIEDRLRSSSFERLVEEHRDLSSRHFEAALRERYQDLSRVTYDPGRLWGGSVFTQFSRDYPVIASTCHALPGAIGPDALLDYVIIDEASQVDLLAAAPVLARCRRLVVVGDSRQLGQISAEAGRGRDAPHPAFDYMAHSMLSSLHARYGDNLPKTLLREHYRCDPAIIGYCNKAFYAGALIPFTRPGDERPMTVVRTAAGNHMRRHQTGGRSNRREVDVIEDEVIPHYCKGFEESQIGIAAPYNQQVDLTRETVTVAADVATVHKYQGRQKPVMILTTVLDETRSGRSGLEFVDDARLVNVAVSRAAEKFVLVTNNDLLPSSRHLRDLIGYIGYQNPDQDVVDSDVLSVFDLLYQNYDRRLDGFASRRRFEIANPAEDIVWTLLHELLSEPEYAHLVVARQMLLRTLLPNLNGLTPDQERFVRNGASLDFVVYNRISNLPWLAIEVDGFRYHANDPVQLRRDRLKDQIFEDRALGLLRLPTTTSRVETQIREALKEAERRWLDRS
ncbi:DUF2726 domain-containing protein [Kineosporia sp. J2-2]|uniref:DUF2726 domain-containing protein n=1 Tax=Kineosporia corallincola TaxID=2835133 RepID=A0ABS5TU09_9ACTN|nr:AAA domain-containing protein [Kineosporia corallincola]MBT0774284.1 DUF2726 domain-containing protein [Kineosporia corallincola]